MFRKQSLVKIKEKKKIINMKRNTIRLSDLTHQILIERRVNKLLENISSVASSVQGELKKLGDDVVDAGLDMADDEVQAALLMSLLDSKGDIDKVDVSDVEAIEKQVQEARGHINESASGVGAVVHTIGDILGNAAVVEVLSIGIAKITGKKDSDVGTAMKKVQKIFKNVGAIAGLPGKAIERAFKWIAAKWGAGEKTQKIFGIVGMMMFVVVMFIIGVLSFPSLTSAVTITIGVTALLGKTVEFIKLTKHLIHSIGKHEKEISDTNKTDLEKKIDKWMDAPISGPDSQSVEMAKNFSMMR